jgi:hypothetical protein
VSRSRFGVFVSGALLAACGTILGAPGDDDVPADARPPTGDAAVDAPVSAEGGSSACTSRCPVLRDDFERSATDVRGAWARVVGAPTIAAATGNGTGNALVERGGVKSSPSRDLFLEHDLPRTRSVELAASVRAATDVASGSFGPSYADFCEFASFLIDGRSIVLVYRDGNTDYLYIWGTSTAFPVWTPLGVAQIFGRLVVRVIWTDTNITATLSRDGAVLASVTNALQPGEADGQASMRLGVHCGGQTPDVELVADDVEIVAPL